MNGVPSGVASTPKIFTECSLAILEAAPPSHHSAKKATAAAPSAASTDVLSRALVGMGYKPAEAERAIEQLGDKMYELPIADLVKEALSVLSK